jgi:hypothetical protein
MATIREKIAFQAFLVSGKIMTLNGHHFPEVKFNLDAEERNNPPILQDYFTRNLFTGKETMGMEANLTIQIFLHIFERPLTPVDHQKK